METLFIFEYLIQKQKLLSIRESATAFIDDMVKSVPDYP